MLHISEIADRRVKDVRDELKEGQQILVKCIGKEEKDQTFREKQCCATKSARRKHERRRIRLTLASTLHTKEVCEYREPPFSIQVRVSEVAPNLESIYVIAYGGRTSRGGHTSSLLTAGSVKRIA